MLWLAPDERPVVHEEFDFSYNERCSFVVYLLNISSICENAKRARENFARGNVTKVVRVAIK